MKGDNILEGNFKLNPILEASKKATKEAIGGVTLVSCKDPFGLAKRVVTRSEHAPGWTVSDYIDPTVDLNDLVIVHNGVSLDPSEAESIEVRPGDCIAVMPIPRGGGDNKSVMRLVAFAVLAAASGGASLALGGGLLGAIGSIGVSVVGGMLINELMPPEVPSIEQQAQDDQSPSYSIDGPKSTSQQGLAMPVIYGKHMMAPNRILIRTTEDTPDFYQNVIEESIELPPGFINTVVEMALEARAIDQGRDQQTVWLHMVFALGEGPLESITNIKLNDTDLDVFNPGSYVVDWRRGDRIQRLDSDFQFNGRTISHGVELDTSHYVFTTSDDVTSLNLVFSFPIGLLKRSENGTAMFHSVGFEVEYKLAGSADPWERLALYPSDDGGIGDGLTETDVMLWSAVEGWLLGEGQSTDLTSEQALRDFFAPLTIYDTRPPNSVYDETSKAGSVTPADVSRQLASSGKIVEKYYYRIIETIPGATYATATGTVTEPDKHVVSVVGFSYKQAPAQNSVVRTLSKSPFVQSFQSFPIPLGTYDVRVRRTSSPKYTSDPQHYQDKAVLQEVREQLPTNIRYSHTALLGIAVRASKQFTRVPNVVCEVKGRIIKIRYFNDATKDYEWTTGWTANPAWIVYDILTDTRINTRPVPEGNVIIEQFQTLADYCDENGVEFNGVFDRASRNRWDVCQEVLRVCHGQLIRSGDKYGVVFDAPGVPVMMFNDTNIKKSSVSLEWMPMEDRANTMEVTYFNKDKNYRRDVVRGSVEDPIIGDNVQPVKMEVQGIVTHDQASKYVQYKLRQNLYLRKNIEFEAPIESIALSLGDLFYFQSRVADWNQAGRIATGSTDTVLQLDRPIDLLFSQNSYDILVHYDQISVATGLVQEVIGTFVTLTNYNGEDANSLILNGMEYDVIDIIQHNSYWGVQLRNSIVASQGDSYVLKAYDRIETRSISASTDGEHTQVTLDTALPQAPDALAKFTIGPIETIKDIFRCTAISGDSTSQMRSIRGIQYDARVFEQGDVIAPTPGTVSNFIPAVTDLTWTESAANSAIAPDGEVLLSWNSVPGGNYLGAWIYRSEQDPDSGEYGSYVTVGTASSGAKIFRDSVSRGVNYAYTVVAFGPDEKGSQETAAPTVYVNLGASVLPPAAPTNVVGTALESGARITWTALSSPLLRYTEVLSSGVDDIAGAVVIDRTEGEVFEEYLTPGTTRYYWVRSVDNQGQLGPAHAASGVLITALQNTVNADEISPPPAYTQDPVINLASVPVFQAVSLSWVNPYGQHFSHVELYKSPDSNFANATLLAQVSTEEYRDEIIDDTATYYYWVRAVSLYGHTSTYAGPVNSFANQILNPSDVPDLDAAVQAAQAAANQNAQDITANANALSAQATELATQAQDIADLQAHDALTDANVQANADALTGIDARVTANEGEITSQAVEITALEASMVVALADDLLVFRQNTAPVPPTAEETPQGDPSMTMDFTTGEYASTGIPEGSLWYDTSDGNRVYVWENGAWVDTQDTAIAANATAVQGLDARVTQTETDITAQASDITQLQTDVTNAQAGVNGNSSALTALDSRVTQTETDITAQASDITQLQTDVSSAQSDATANATAIQGLNTRVTANESGISANSTDITQLQTDVSNAQTGVNANTAAVSSLGTRVTANENELLAQSSQITDLQASLDGVAPPATWLSSDPVSPSEAGVAIAGQEYLTLDFQNQTYEALVVEHGSIWRDQDEPNISYTYNGYDLIFEPTPEYGIKVNAGATESLETRVTATESEVTSQAQYLLQVDSNVGDLNASVTEQATAIDGVLAKYSLTLDANGVVTGIELISGEGQSSMIVQADKFAVIPSTSPTPLSVTPETGLNILPDKMGYYSASAGWQCYIDKTGGFRFGGSSEETAMTFNNDRLILGEEVGTPGFASINNDSYLVMEYFGTSYIRSGWLTASGGTATQQDTCLRLMVTNANANATLSYPLPPFIGGTSLRLKNSFRGRLSMRVSTNMIDQNDLYPDGTSIQMEILPGMIAKLTFAAGENDPIYVGNLYSVYLEITYNGNSSGVLKIADYNANAKLYGWDLFAWKMLTLDFGMYKKAGSDGLDKSTYFIEARFDEFDILSINPLDPYNVPANRVEYQFQENDDPDYTVSNFNFSLVNLNASNLDDKVVELVEFKLFQRGWG